MLVATGRDPAVAEHSRQLLVQLAQQVEADDRLLLWGSGTLAVLLVLALILLWRGLSSDEGFRVETHWGGLGGGVGGLEISRPLAVLICTGALLSLAAASFASLQADRRALLEQQARLARELEAPAAPGAAANVQHATPVEGGSGSPGGSR